VLRPAQRSEMWDPLQLCVLHRRRDRDASRVAHRRGSLAASARHRDRRKPQI